MAKPKRDVMRVGATVPRHVVDTWKAAAKIQGLSLSALVAEWMTELEPGMRDVVRLREAFAAADAAQRDQIRSAVLSAGDTAQETLLATWDPVRDSLGETSDVE